jgi:hypothetical protein
MEWLRGHHSEVLFAQVSKACSGEQATSNSISIGSIGSVKGRPVSHRHDALVVEPVEPPGAFGPIGHQPGLLEQPQVP